MYILCNFTLVLLVGLLLSNILRLWTILAYAFILLADNGQCFVYPLCIVITS